MGESITEGTLTKWRKKRGDRVEQDEPLFEISTDKVDTEIPSPAAGILAEVLVEEGATVVINTVVARIAEAGDGAGAAAAPAEEASAVEPAALPSEAPAPAAEAAPPPPAPAPSPAAPEAAAPAAPETVSAAEAEEGLGPISPLVRRMAREHNIDLRQVKGTGAGGRITKADVEAYLAARAAAAAPPPPPKAPAPAPAAPVAAPAAPPPVMPPPPAAEEVKPVAPAAPPRTRVEPMSIMRQKIAEHMIYSRRTSAHVTTVHRCDMTAIAKLRSALKDQFHARYGFGLTYLPFVVRAAAQALREFPVVNASVEGTNILYHNDINIGIAVALENGLIVPVIRRADELSIVGIQRAIVDLAHRARSRQLKPDEVQGGTFSITNFGSFGSLFATPIINQPQVAILGVGAVTKEPVIIDDAIAIRSMCYLALTFDHRIIDGALADQFCQKVKSVLETWSEQVL
jgi:2-oxoglutarate dehydrogenase E2 component (dihydrolipoamide succinyltransferase)